MSLKTALYIAQEVSPYVVETHMSRLGRLIPQGLQEDGVEVRTFMPKYSQINERRNQLHEVIRLSGLNISIDDTDHPLIIKVATLMPTRMQVYFIDNDDFFPRSDDKTLELYASPADNDERLMFFARGVIETVRKLRWAPNVVGCMGWASALSPLYIRRRYADDPTLRDAKIVYHFFKDNAPEPLNPRLVNNLIADGFVAEDLAPVSGTDTLDAIALGKLAIDFSDAVVQGIEDAHPELVEYARQSGKPYFVLDNENEQSRESYREFLANL